MKTYQLVQAITWLTWTLPLVTQGQSPASAPANLNWAWVGGSQTINSPSVYGTQGVAAANNIPGGRCQHSLVYHPGMKSVFLFGGDGYDADGSRGFFNDLWSLNLLNYQWTWVSGKNTVFHPGIYGTKGVPSANNVPRARWGASMLIDSVDNLIFVFAGATSATGGTIVRFNDLWQYNVTSGEWTWLSGSPLTDQKGTYGTIGIPAAANVPGSRDQPGAVFHPSSNSIYVFGGFGCHSTCGDFLNDFWQFNLASRVWTWIGGSKVQNQAGIYGTKGISGTSNMPGARGYSTVAMDPTGNLMYILMGYGYSGNSSSGPGYLNDAWRYDFLNGAWTWIAGSDITNQAGTYGDKGSPSDSNVPGARSMSSASYVQGLNSIVMFGGFDGVEFSDAWLFDTTSGQWTWIAGADARNQLAFYGDKGISLFYHSPGGGYSGSLVAAGNLIVYFGGKGVSGSATLNDDFTWSATVGYLNDLWVIPLSLECSPEVLCIVDGIECSAGYYRSGQFCVLCPPNTYKSVAGDQECSACPANAACVANDFNCAPKYTKAGLICAPWANEGNLFGHWTWLGGNQSINQPGSYGTINIPGASNMPGSRTGNGLVYQVGSNSAFMFAGFGFDSAGSKGYLNDLWHVNLSNYEWTWRSGSNLINDRGVYGTIGETSITNMPCSREAFQMVIDSQNEIIFVFGGYVDDSGSLKGYLNDLWKYNITSGFWTLLSGGNTTDALSVYGVKGIATDSTIPGGRAGQVTVFNPFSNSIYVFGGFGYQNNIAFFICFDDFWQFDLSTRQWTWFKGSDSGNQFGNYGSKGVPSVRNKPGGRYSAASAMHPVQNVMYLMGGQGYDQWNTPGDLSDLWRFNFTDGMWTWMAGNNYVGPPSYYGTKDATTSSFLPGTRFRHSMVISQRLNAIVLFGGKGYLSDTWMLNLDSFHWTWIDGPETINEFGTYGTRGVSSAGNNPGSRDGAMLISVGDYLLIFGGSTYPLTAGLNNEMWMLPIFPNCSQNASCAEGTFICPVGYYKSGQECLACPKNASCSSKDFICDVGFTRSANGRICDTCLDGWYKELPGNEACQKCPTNSSCTKTGFACNAGFSRNNSGCKPCPTGTFKESSGNESCIACPQNGTCTSTGFQCLPGFYRKGLICEACPAGRYKSSLSAATCSACPSNSICTPTGYACLTGYYFSIDRCLPCAAGWYKSSHGNQLCDRCPDNSVCGATAFTCNAGYFNQSSSCFACAYGYFKNSIGNIECTICPANSICTSTGFVCSSSYVQNGTLCVTVGDSSAPSSTSNHTFQTTTTSGTEGTASSSVTEEILETALPKQPSGASSSMTFLLDNVYIIVGVGVGFIALASTAWVLIHRAKRISAVQKTIPVLDNTTQAYMGMGTKAATTHSGNTTLLDNNSVLALPGYDEVPNSSVVDHQLLATGGCGTVHLSEIRHQLLQKRANGDLMCVSKRPNIDSIQRPEFWTEFTQEVSLMKYLSSDKNIVTFLAFTSKPPAIMMKYYPLGSLANFVHKGIPGFTMNINSSFNMIHGIASAVQFMHNRGIAHCDLKPLNVLLEAAQSPGGEFLRPILTDFGVARITSQGPMAVRAFRRVEVNAASIRYAAPEVLQAFNSGASITDPREITAGDVYSLMIIVYELITRKLPWK